MRAVRFDKEKHYPEICQWAIGHGLPVPRKDLFPENGRIVPGFAAMFLYLTDSKLAFFENTIANPKTSPSENYPALVSCAVALEKDAKDLEVECLVGTTPLSSIALIASKRLGFTLHAEKYQLLTKRLKS